MKKMGLVALGLVIVSTMILLVLFVLKAIENQNQLKEIGLTQTAMVSTQWAEDTLAAIPTETPLPSATLTPEPTATPTLEPTATSAPTDTQASVLIEGCDVAAFVDDVTIPDGKELDPDTKFIKTWRLYNDGTCTWNRNYRLYFVSGDQMSGPSSQQLTPLEVPPGASIDVSVELRTPDEPGTYKGYWGLKNTNGAEFGIGPAGQPFYVEVKVVD